MQHYQYSPWVSGTSLMLLSAALTAEEKIDALDSQLFSWLKGQQDYSAFSDDELWQREYLATQEGLGMVFSAKQQNTNPRQSVVSITPLSTLLPGLLGALPATVRPGIEACLAALQALPVTHPALQALRAEAVEDRRPDVEGSAGLGKITFELRVVLPGGQVVASSLYLNTTESIDQVWLGQTLSVSTLGYLRLTQCTGQLLEATFAGVRADMRAMLKETRPWYLLEVKI